MALTNWSFAAPTIPPPSSLARPISRAPRSAPLRKHCARPASSSRCSSRRPGGSVFGCGPSREAAASWCSVHPRLRATRGPILPSGSRSPAAPELDGSGLLNQLDVDRDLHLVAHQDPARLQRLIPVQAEVLAVELAR